MATLLERPQAQELLDQAQVDPARLCGCRSRLTDFIARYLPLFTREEQRQHAKTILQGKLTSLDRKTTEPIALQADQYRRPLQHFLGAGRWSDEGLRKELACHVNEQIGEEDAIFILDPSGFPKKGNHSCGVARQWCGRLGKTDNCQVGVFLAYSSSKGKTLVDTQLYLPEDRGNDADHRKETFVPDEVAFQTKWQISLDLLARQGSRLEHGWVCGDDELGRVIAFRDQLRKRQERYVLDVPCDTLIRDWSEYDPSLGTGPPYPDWERVDHWTARQPESAWKRVWIKDGTKGPLVVWALEKGVQTKGNEEVQSTMERLVVLRSDHDRGQVWYTLSNAGIEEPTEVLARVHGSRHGIEEIFEEGNDKVGLDEYEVRSWTGWAHHMTLSLLALWFLQLQKGQFEKKTPAITVSLLGEIFQELLKQPSPSSKEIARVVNAKLKRNEESRIYAHFQRTNQFPPPRQPNIGLRGPGP